MSDIPIGTTHVWTPAVEHPIVGFSFRRAYYKRKDNVWYSYNVHGEWVVSSNTPGWFAEEKKQGFFVTKVKFTNPKFVLIKEAYHV